MTLAWKKSDGFLMADDRQIQCWSKVRNELNGLRPLKANIQAGNPDICLSSPDNLPMMPRDFPIGNHRFTGYHDHPDPNYMHGYLFPGFLATDAGQMVDVWDLDEHGFYLRPSGRQVWDADDGLHFSTSDWTQGCLRIATIDDMRWLIARWNAGDLKIGDPFDVAA